MASSILLLAAAVTPWFDNPGLAGGIIGGGIGIIGGLYGTIVGILAPRGAGRGFVFAMHWTFVVAGVVLLGAGVAGVATGQPFPVWFALLLPGAILTTLMVSFTPIVKIRYRQAEHRRLEAEEFRRA